MNKTKADVLNTRPHKLASEYGFGCKHAAGVGQARMKRAKGRALQPNKASGKGMRLARAEGYCAVIQRHAKGGGTRDAPFEAVDSVLLASGSMADDADTGEGDRTGE